MFTITHKFKRNIFILSFIIFVVILIFLYLNNEYFSITKEKSKGASNNTTNNTKIGVGGYTNKLIKNLAIGSDDISDKKGLVKEYCNTLLNSKLKAGFTVGDSVKYKYNPKKSVFLYNLCSFVDTNEEKFSLTTGSSGKLKSTFDLRYKEECRNDVCDTVCDPSGNLNDCDIGSELSEPFNKLINEYFNIKLANIYGYSKEKISYTIKKFSEKYFPTNCGGRDDKIYLNKKELAGDEGKFCSHPKTYEMLKKQIENIKSLVEKTKFINTDQALVYADKKCKRTSEKPSLVCAFTLHTSKTNSDLKDFKNLYLNDYFFYRMFLTYYSYYISTHGKFMELSMTSGIGKKLDEFNKEKKFINQELVRTKKALSKSQKMLANVYYTFPLHIALMAYHEDLLNFREKLAKVYTPIHQLYYKLRNVQTKRR